MRHLRRLAVLCAAGALPIAFVAAGPAAYAEDTCGGRPVTISGTAGSDTITGTPFPDVISAGAGDDVVSALGEADVVCLGPGADTFFGADGDDLVVFDAAADGADRISGGTGRDRVDYGARTAAVNVSLDGAPNDGAAGEGDAVLADVEILDGGAGGDTLSGRFLGGGSTEIIRGNAGADMIKVFIPFSSAVGGPGDDTIDGSAGTGDVQLLGEDGNDTITGGPGNDTLAGKNGADTINGGAGNDTITGDDNPNTTIGGDDTLNGGPGDDQIRADVGNDVMRGEGGNDLLNGLAGNDIAIGGPGDDEVIGGDGNDQSIADPGPDGADIFFGEAGTDTMSYSLRTGTVFVTPDDLPDDGALNEGDNVDGGVENITGGQGDDFLFGNNLPNRLFGGLGSDVLNAVDGISGNDVVNGAQGSGTDRCTADPGDTITNCP